MGWEFLEGNMNPSIVDLINLSLYSTTHRFTVDRS